MSLLALTCPPDSKPDFRHPHEFPNPSHSFNAIRTPRRGSGEMTSNPSRGLPPPGAIGLPDPIRSSVPPPQSLASLPAPPSGWHGAEESMRVWLSAKMEDDKRRQEELKLEQRRLEDRMLRDAYQSPVPPHLIPVIFAGLSGGPLASASLDIAQQHLAQLHQQQQQQHTAYPAAVHASPEPRHDPRMASQPQYITSHPPPQQAPSAEYLDHREQAAQVQAQNQARAGQAMPPQQHSRVYAPPSYHTSPRNPSKSLYGPPIQQYAPHTASGRGQAQAGLPRLSTNDPGPAPQPGYGQQQEQNSPSPNIYFHHWQPPAPNAKELKDAGKPPTNPPWRISGQDFSSSPRGKRKATGAHEQRGPPPTSNPATTTSPTYSQASSASGKSHRRQASRESTTQRSRAYDVIERRNPRETREPSSRDNSTSGRSQRSPSRHQTPREGEEDSKRAIAK